MNLDVVNGLLFSCITITHHGKSIFIPKVVIDTLAAESILSIDAVAELFNDYEPEDQIRFMTGIGEYTEINGLIGLGILIPGNFIVDLHRLQLYPASIE
ncbi:MAG: hypothetical protein K0Q73_7388 [Paenibacillus sp.]|jgi:hypothetical protein|nr:hypothetical protein [Paenibacillus sp.]